MMASTDFRPSNCGKCAGAIFAGLGYVPMPLRLDATPLNLAQEILAKLQGRATYEAHRTGISFEVTPRSLAYIGSRNPVVLATHQCRDLVMFGEVAADLWGRDITKTTTESNEVPF